MIRNASPQVASPTRRGTSGTALALILLALLVSGIAFRYWPSDDRDVRRHLVHLAEALSVPGKDSEVEHITRYTVLRIAPPLMVTPVVMSTG